MYMDRSLWVAKAKDPSTIKRPDGLIVFPCTYTCSCVTCVGPK